MNQLKENTSPGGPEPRAELRGFTKIALFLNWVAVAAGVVLFLGAFIMTNLAALFLHAPVMIVDLFLLGTLSLLAIDLEPSKKARTQLALTLVAALVLTAAGGIINFLVGARW